MCETLAMLVNNGSLEREAVAQFLRDGFMNWRPHARCYVWQGWQSAIILLGMYELSSLMRKACQRGLIGPGWIQPDEFEADLRRHMDQGQVRQRRIQPLWRYDRGTLDLALVQGIL
jgi:hypothetical protein